MSARRFLIRRAGVRWLGIEHPDDREGMGTENEGWRAWTREGLIKKLQHEAWPPQRRWQTIRFVDELLAEATEADGIVGEPRNKVSTGAPGPRALRWLLLPIAAPVLLLGVLAGHGNIESPPSSAWTEYRNVIKEWLA